MGGLGSMNLIFFLKTLYCQNLLWCPSSLHQVHCCGPPSFLLWVHHLPVCLPVAFFGLQLSGQMAPNGSCTYVWFPVKTGWEKPLPYLSLLCTSYICTTDQVRLEYQTRPQATSSEPSYCSPSLAFCMPWPPCSSLPFWRLHIPHLSPCLQSCPRFFPHLWNLWLLVTFSPWLTPRPRITWHPLWSRASLWTSSSPAFSYIPSGSCCGTLPSVMVRNWPIFFLPLLGVLRAPFRPPQFPEQLWHFGGDMEWSQHPFAP